jgi:hypothetical protein
LVEVIDWVDAAAATAALLVERLVVVASSLVVVAGMAVVAVPAAAVEVPVDVFPAEVLVVATMQPVSVSKLATLSEPAILRARRAGWGRGRRDGVVLIVPPRADTAWCRMNWCRMSWCRMNNTRIGPGVKRHLGVGQEASKNLP